MIVGDKFTELKETIKRDTLTVIKVSDKEETSKDFDGLNYDLIISSEKFEKFLRRYTRSGILF